MERGSSNELPRERTVEECLEEMFQLELGHLALIYELIHEEDNDEP